MTALEKLQARGIRRTGSLKSGFRFRTAEGKPVSAADEERARALVLPPAWKNVFINPSASAKLQAVGQDAAGRWQYRYHSAHTRAQDQKKYQRLLKFANTLPSMRKRLKTGLRSQGLTRERVMACILRILSTCFVRPGSEVYAKENGSFGIATLRRKHVAVRGDRLILDFRGKSGQQQHRELVDRSVARVVRALLKAPGHEVFKYQDESGAWVDIKRRHINGYIKEVMGERFSAKDFRTWAGTLICACALARAGFDAGESKAARKRKVVSAVKETAEMLGNTPSVCRSSYISPSVISGFDRGKVVAAYFDSVEELVEHHVPGFHASEKALLKMLQQDAVSAG